MADIGDKLRSARKAKGMSIEDIEKITKIQRRYLTAIENNEFDQLPGDFYVRAFIRQYADIVGLDGKELLEDFQSEVPEAKPEEYVENSIDNKSEEIRETTNNKKGLWKSYLPKVAVIVGILLVILVIYLVYAHLFSGSNQQSANNASESVTVSSHVTSTKSSKKSTKKSEKKATSAVKVSKLSNNSYRITGLKNNRTLKLSTGSSTVWAQVTVNGQASWQGTLQANKSHEVKLPANVQNVSVQLGNTQTTKITIAGKRIPVAQSASPATLQLAFGKATAASSTTTQSSTTAQSSSTSQSQTTSTVQSQQSSQVYSTQTQNTTGSQNNGGQNNQ